MIDLGFGRMAVAAAVAGAAGVASAQLDEGDIGVALEGPAGDQRIVTSLIPEDDGTAPAPQRVFLVELGVVEFEPEDPEIIGDGGTDVFQDVLPAEQSFSSNVPGFDSGPGVFDPAAQVGLTLLSGLERWDADLGAFVRAELTDATAGLGGSVGESVSIQFNLDVLQSAEPTPSLQPLPVATAFPGLDVFSNGRFHRHYNYTLLPVEDPFSATPTSLAEPGVYAIELTLTTTQTGISPSLPFYLVFPLGVDEDGPEATAAIAALLDLTSDEADFNGDGVIDVFDLIDFLVAFAAA